MKSCAVCGTRTTKRCGKCGSVWYCGRDCQRRDWKTHKINCNPYEIRESNGNGLGVFATCNLEIGDLIVRENPILYIDGGGAALAWNGEKFRNPYQALSRAEKDRVLALTGAESDTVSNEEEWRKGLRIYDRNSIRVDTDQAGFDSALYTTLARINHSCAPNAEWSFMEEEREVKEVRAIRRIGKGEEVVVDYLSGLSVTQGLSFPTCSKRREILAEKWGFCCACSLCASDHVENDSLRRKLQQLHQDVLNHGRRFDIQGAVDAARAKCHILEMCEDLVSELPMAYLELYETLIVAKQYTVMLRHRSSRTTNERCEEYREKAFDLMKRTKLATNKEGYNKKMMGLARRYDCYNALME